MTQVVFGLGSNVGDAPRQIQSAITSLQEFVSIRRVSSLYRSRPMYKLDQEWFVNAAASAETVDGPLSLLKKIKSVEGRLGRVQRERNGPREIDIDLLVYGSLTYEFWTGSETRLAIPHPKLSERRFVLLPLVQIAPDLRIPGAGVVSELLARTNAQSDDVTPIEDEFLSLQR